MYDKDALQGKTLAELREIGRQFGIGLYPTDAKTCTYPADGAVLIRFADGNRRIEPVY